VAREIAALVDRESTHGVYRKHVEVLLRGAVTEPEVAQHIALAMHLAARARTIDPNVDHETRPRGGRGIAVEFVTDRPDRVKRELDAWVAEQDADVRAAFDPPA
jgi:hypothetical protein